MPKDVLQDVLNSEDILGRLKVIEYPQLYEIDFNGKPSIVSSIKIVYKTLEDLSPENLNLLENVRDSLRFSRADYGLTRLETILLIGSKKILASGGRASDFEGTKDTIMNAVRKAAEMINKHRN